VSEKTATGGFQEPLGEMAGERPGQLTRRFRQGFLEHKDELARLGVPRPQAVAAALQDATKPMTQKGHLLRRIPVRGIFPSRQLRSRSAASSRRQGDARHKPAQPRGFHRTTATPAFFVPSTLSQAAPRTSRYYNQSGEGKNHLTQRRKGGREDGLLHSLCAFAPLREVIFSALRLGIDVVVIA